MRWSPLILLIVFSIFSIVCYLILNLNNNIVSLDLLFYEIDVKLGFILITFLLVGFFVTLILEALYKFSKKSSSSQ